MQKGPWHLYEQTRQQQWSDLDFAECVKFVKTAQADTPSEGQDSFPSWYVWRSDFPDWKPILEVGEFAAALRTEEISQIKPPPTPQAPPPSSQKAEAGSVTSSVGEKRKFPRFFVRLRVVLRSENLTFRTFTKNLSLGGASLEHPIPQGLLKEHCQIYLADPETAQNIRFKARIIQELQDAKGIAFEDLAAADEKKIQMWIGRFARKTGAL